MARNHPDYEVPGQSNINPTSGSFSNTQPNVANPMHQVPGQDQDLQKNINPTYPPNQPCPPKDNIHFKENRSGVNTDKVKGYSVHTDPAQGNPAKTHKHETEKGAAMGAAFGSVLPVVGTVAGAAVGAAVGHQEMKKHIKEGTHDMDDKPMFGGKDMKSDAQKTGN